MMNEKMQPNAHELDENDLENVSGGYFTEVVEGFVSTLLGNNKNSGKGKAQSEQPFCPNCMKKGIKSAGTVIPVSNENPEKKYICNTCGMYFS